MALIAVLLIDTVRGKNRFLYQILPSQINLLTMGFLRIMSRDTPPNSEIICIQNVGAKVEMVSYLKK